MFLAAKWVIEALDRYHNRPPRATIMGKRIIFPNYHYLAALLHIYTGTFNLRQIADLSSLPYEELSFYREQLDFMTLVDYLKTKFSEWFRESLLMRDFSLPEYVDIAWEYTKLDEMVRSQIKIPLLERLKHLMRAGEEKIAAGRTLDTYDQNVFRRLMSFFILAETLSPTLSSRLVKEKALPVAEKSLDGIGAFKEWSADEVKAKDAAMLEELVRDLREGTKAFL